jgi:hypothetical protein
MPILIGDLLAVVVKSAIALTTKARFSVSANAVYDNNESPIPVNPPLNTPTCGEQAGAKWLVASFCVI